MFETLLASAARHERRPMPAMAAVGLHSPPAGNRIEESYPAPVRAPIVPGPPVFSCHRRLRRRLRQARCPSFQPHRRPWRSNPRRRSGFRVSPATDPGVPLALPGPGGLPATGVAGTPSQSVTIQSISSLAPIGEVERRRPSCGPAVCATPRHSRRLASPGRSSSSSWSIPPDASRSVPSLSGPPAPPSSRRPHGPPCSTPVSAPPAPRAMPSVNWSANHSFSN